MDSIDHYQEGKWEYFEKRVPSRHKWRAFGDLADRALYLDIETTGLGVESDITVVGTYDGRTYRSFVLGQNLRDLQAHLEGYPLVVTFNGATFDMPMIRAKFPCLSRNHVHVDLRYPLKSIGYSGGLKKIERSLGIARTDETKDLDGYDAVRLWRAYERGSQQALELLVEYNREDVVNLGPLMRLVFEKMSRLLRDQLGE
jgi:uncharacterized protein YprB with RNaseH-like and TPR domain